MSDYTMAWDCDTVVRWIDWRESARPSPPAAEFKYRETCDGGPHDMWRPVFTLDSAALAELLGELTVADQPDGMFLVNDFKGTEWRIKGDVFTDYGTWCSNFAAWEWGIGFVVVQDNELYATNKYVYDRFVEHIGALGFLDMGDI